MTFTKNKMTRISKVSTTAKFARTFDAILNNLILEGKVNPKMTAKVIAGIIDEKMIADQIAKMNEEFEATTPTETAYTETAFARAGKTPWVAVIAGKDAKYGVKREFVNADTKSGDKHTWTLTSGKIYEAFEKTSHTKEYRGFFKIVDGKKVTMTKDQVIASFA